MHGNLNERKDFTPSFWQQINSTFWRQDLFGLFSPRQTVSSGPSSRISSKKAHELLEENKWNIDFIVIDVRTEREHISSRIKTPDNEQLLISTSDFEKDEKLSKLDKSKTYLLYCQTWMRSWGMISRMQAMWFKNVSDTAWIGEWKRSWYEVEWDPVQPSSNPFDAFRF